jgi:hypothetical protein
MTIARATIRAEFEFGVPVRNRAIAKKGVCKALESIFRVKGRSFNASEASENAERCEHRFAGGNSLGSIARSRHVDVQRERCNRAIPFYPSGPPSKVWAAGKAPPGLAVKHDAVAALKPNDVARDRLRTDGRVELLLRQPCDEASFLDGADFKRSVQPECVDDCACLPVAEVQPGEPLSSAMMVLAILKVEAGTKRVSARSPLTNVR